VTDADAGLKRETAKWFWRMGSSTLLTVRLSTYESKPRGRIVELTDLDVLAIEVGQDFGVRFRTAECKSGKAGARELFWLRGVSTFFGADESYLVLGQDKLRTKAVRGLADSLDLGVIARSDFPTLFETYPESQSDLERLLFDEERIEVAERRLATLDKRLDKFNDYLRRLYWQMPPYRHLQLGVAYLDHARPQLDFKHPLHVALFIELVYRQCLAIFNACQAVIRGGVGSPGDHLPAYLHGGEAGLREATRRIEAAEQVQKELEGEQRVDLVNVFNAMPAYYPDLLEVVTRICRRPRHANSMLRHLQVARSVALFRDSAAVSGLLGDEYDPIAVKLVHDVVGFLAKAANLDGQARVAVRELFDPGERNSPVEVGSRQAREGAESSQRERSEQQRLRVE
jgi:hypothetical protein